MKFCVNILILLLVAVVGLILFKEIEKEGYRGHGDHGHHGHHGHHRGHGHWRRRHRYHRPSSYTWFNPWYWFRGLCRNGCTNIGRGEWGCQYPGTGPNDCWFASDCIGCGN